MDSPDAIERIVKRWKERGIEGVYWRVDESMLPERFMSRWNQSISLATNSLLRRGDEVQSRFPVHKTLLAAAERQGIEMWAWYPTLYSNGAPAEGPRFKYPWLSHQSGLRRERGNSAVVRPSSGRPDSRSGCGRAIRGNRDIRAFERPGLGLNAPFPLGTRLIERHTDGTCGQPVARTRARGAS